MIKQYSKIKLVLVLFFVSFIFACNQQVNEKNEFQDTILNNQTEIAFDKAKAIYYSLPSPVETAMVLENSKVQFDDSFLLPIKYADYYVKSSDQALNLGVYAADLSYISMFDMQQESIKYLSACKKLIEKLGLTNVIDDSVISNLSDNILNKSQTLNIISEQFMNINAYFEENNRAISATLMILGGWVEGLYISVNLIGDNVLNNTDLAQMIYDQSISLEDLISLLEMYKNNPEIKQHLVKIYELKQIYQNIETPISQDNFMKIKSKVQKIRFSFTYE